MNQPTDYFCSDALRRDLRRKTVRGGIATACTQGVATVLRVVSAPLIAALLLPDDLGLVSMVTVFTGFASMFVNAGLSTASVQRQELNHQQATNLFWCAVGLGLSVAAVVAACSPVIAWFYSRPRLTAITLALTIPFVLNGFAIQHQALMQRAMHLSRIAVVDCLAQTAGTAAGVAWALAYRGRPGGYWAFVAILLTSAVVRVSLLWVACSWRPGLPKRGAGTRSMLEFGANLTGTNFISYFAMNADKAMIGWWWGEAVLGSYSLAYRVVLQPLLRVIGPAGTVVVPMLSRLIAEPDRYRRTFQGMLTAAFLFTAPVFAYTATTADLLVAAFLTEEWVGVGPVLRWLAIAAVGQVVTWTLSWLCITQGRGGELFRMVVVRHVSTLLGIALALPWGATAVAAVFALTGLLFRLPLSVFLAGRRGVVSVDDLLASLRPAAVPVAVTAGACLAARWAADGLPALAGLAVVAAAGAAAWLLAAWSTGTLQRGVNLVREIRHARSGPKIPNRSDSN